MMFGLKVAACLGSKFNAQVIDKIKKDDEIEDTFLQECINLGFFECQEILVCGSMIRSSKQLMI